MKFFHLDIPPKSPFGKVGLSRFAPLRFLLFLCFTFDLCFYFNLTQT